MPLTPNNREEHWLQGMVDGQTSLTPNNRREHWYQEIINNGGGGGGGTGGGVLVVGVEMGETTMTLDKSWKEIYDAPFAILVINSVEEDMTYKGSGFIAQIQGELGVYSVSAFMPSIGESAVIFTPVIFSTQTENGYPVADNPE